ncbi:MAG: AEC family transporter [Nitrospirota bacterium]|nr:MAG: AEC family transporter [Nitrospirota bacterium]
MLIALIPVFIVILIGYGLRRAGFPGDEFWPHIEKLTYYVLFPALLFERTVTVQLDPEIIGPSVIVLITVVLTMSAFIMIVRNWWRAGEPAFTSFFQGSIRFNTYIGLSASYALFGEGGLSLAAFIVAIWIPLVNVLCVTVLVVFTGHGVNRSRTIVLEIVRNPVIVACAGGLLFNATGLDLNKVLLESLSLFGRASLPMGLMAVGAGLELASAHKNIKIVAASCLLKLVLLPLLMLVISSGLGLERTMTLVAILFASLPGSPLSFILARQLGGDSRLMAHIVTAQIIVSMMTMPFIMSLVIR